MAFNTNDILLGEEPVPAPVRAESEIWRRPEGLFVRYHGNDVNLSLLLLALENRFVAKQPAGFPSDNPTALPVTALALNVIGVAAGLYDVYFQYDWSINQSGKAIMVHVVLNPGVGETIIHSQVQRIFNAAMYAANLSVGIRTERVLLTAGDHTIIIRHCVEPGGGPPIITTVSIAEIGLRKTIPDI